MLNFTCHYYPVKHPFSIPCKPDLQSFTLNNSISNIATSPSIPIQKINDLCDTTCWTCQVSRALRCNCNQMLRHLKLDLPLGNSIHAYLFWFLETELYHAAGTGAKNTEVLPMSLFGRSTNDFLLNLLQKCIWSTMNHTHLSQSMSWHGLIAKWQGWAKPSQNLVTLSVYLCALLSAKEMKWDWDNWKYNLQETVGLELPCLIISDWNRPHNYLCQAAVIKVI